MILFLTGTNDFGIRQAIDALVAAAIIANGANAVDRVDGETLDPARLPDLLQGASLFANERLVIIRDASKNKPLWEGLGDYAEKVSSEITLVIVDSAPDKRTRTYKQLQKHGSHQDFPELSEHELAAWAVDVARKEGATLDGRTATYLVRQVGANQWQLSSELAKLIASGQGITRESIDLLVEPSPQASAFELLDATLQGNQARAQEILAKLKTIEDPYKLFGLLVSQVHTLAVVATAVGKSPDAIAREAGIHPFVAKKMQPLARTLSYAQLRGIIGAVALADTQMKSTGADPWMLLAQCLGKIASRA